MRLLRFRKIQRNRRAQQRLRGVLPVRVRGKDASGAVFEGLAHTLDFTATGARLGAIRLPLKDHDTLVVLFHHRRIEFTIMWTRLLDEREYQVGLQVVAREDDPRGLTELEPPEADAAAGQAA
jgi:hypothetical protein